MKSGRLDRIITIQKASVSVNDYGVEAETWADHATVRAEIVQAATNEFIRQGGALSENVTVFRIRFMPGISLADRVVYAGDVFNIVESKEIGRRKGLELRSIARPQA